jgi:heme/copper-type cytochrome/quinol oxidase subunit 2
VAIAVALAALPADCIPRSGQPCTRDQGPDPNHLVDGLGYVALTVEIFIGLAALVVVAALVFWARNQVKDKTRSDRVTAEPIRASE